MSAVSQANGAPGAAAGVIGPPHNLDAEQSVLGAILLSDRTLYALVIEEGLRAGDFYGHSVNLASRVTGVARPDSVLCTKEVHDAAAEFEWSFAGKHRLKGIPERVPLYRAHRIGTPAQESEREADDEKPAKVRRATPKRARRRERSADG